MFDNNAKINFDHSDICVLSSEFCHTDICLYLFKRCVFSKQYTSEESSRAHLIPIQWHEYLTCAVTQPTNSMSFYQLTMPLLAYSLAQMFFFNYTTIYHCCYSLLGLLALPLCNQFVNKILIHFSPFLFASRLGLSGPKLTNHQMNREAQLAVRSKERNHILIRCTDTFICIGLTDPCFQTLGHCDYSPPLPPVMLSAILCIYYLYKGAFCLCLYTHSSLSVLFKCINQYIILFFLFLLAFFIVFLFPLV